MIRALGADGRRWELLGFAWRSRTEEVDRSYCEGDGDVLEVTGLGLDGKAALHHRGKEGQKVYINKEKIKTEREE